MSNSHTKLTRLQPQNQGWYKRLMTSVTSSGHNNASTKPRHNHTHQNSTQDSQGGGTCKEMCTEKGLGKEMCMKHGLCKETSEEYGLGQE